MANKIEEKKRKAFILLLERGFLSFRFTTLSPRFAEFTQYLVNKTLSMYKLNFLDKVVITLLKEVINNAVKANLKRAFFHINNADINDPDQYEIAMEEFQSTAIDNLRSYVKVMKELNLNVQVFVKTNDKGITFHIENNSVMTLQELLRVRNRIERAAQLESAVDALMEFTDDIEGAGLGLLLNIMLLKNSGIGIRNFYVACDNQKTQVTLVIPPEISVHPQISKLYAKIINEIDSIPTFPETIQRIRDLCQNPLSDTEAIGKEIESDPALLAEILKLIRNHANRQDDLLNIQEAIIKYGKGIINDLVMGLSTKKILEEKYPVYQGFWQHGVKVAFYSRILAKMLSNQINEKEAFFGGILHDIGRIVLHSIDGELIHRINGLSIKESSEQAILEEVSLGVSHAEIGAQISENWNFSDTLVDVIRNHHSPFAAKAENCKLVSVVHVADCLAYREMQPKGRVIHVDMEALSNLKINGEKQLLQIHKQLQAIYQNEQNLALE